MTKITDFVKKLINIDKHHASEEGVIKLTHGAHKIRVPLLFCPKKVEFILDEISIPTCSGIIDDSISIVIDGKGFILEAQINTNTRTVVWKANR